MNKADSSCHTCGTKGHFASECANEGIDGNGKPPWCGICDERTRHVSLGDMEARCTVCHPLRRQHLRQFRGCPSCKALVYENDHNPCGSHAGRDMKDRRPDRETIEQAVRAEMENA